MIQSCLYLDYSSVCGGCVDSDGFENLLHVELVLGLEHHVSLHEVDLQQHVLCLPNELLADLRCLFVGFELWVLLAGVKTLLVRINFGFDLARCYQVCKL